MPRIIPVVLCGGSGSRLWPLSRIDTPKQFLKLMDNHTLLQKTVMRTMDISGALEKELVVVTLNGMKAETIRQLHEISPNLTRHVLGEPQARNTAAAVAYATLYVQQVFGDDVTIWILPSDHYVGNEAALSDALGKAIMAADDGYMATFGILPTRPDTGYGYMHKGDNLDIAGAYRVRKFIEKPNRETAIRLMESGDYLWNSGMHVFKASTVRDNYQLHAPMTWNTVRRSLAESLIEFKPSSFVYGTVTEEPFEKAVMERAEKIAVIPCDPEWSDIGSWESLWEAREKNDNGNVMHGKVVCEETENSMILAHGRLVTCVGLKDIVVIETEDSVLVADKKSNGAIKNLVTKLKKNGHKEAISTPTISYNWGQARILAETTMHQIRELTVMPGQMNELEAHTDRSGYWIVSAGEALFMIDGTYKRLKPRESLYIPAQSTYQLSNAGADILRVFQFQCQDNEDLLKHPSVVMEDSVSPERRSA